MSLWEYKVITSGKGGFATPALLEKFLNDLGRDEWEIVDFRAAPENALAFSGLARRSTQRDWTLQDAAAAAAKVEAEKLRAEFEAKFKAATSTSSGTAPEERAPGFLEEKIAPDDGFRKPVDTSRDDEPDAPEPEKDDWDKLTAAEEDDLPTFFDAIKPHMRRNQRGPGMSVGVDYLAKKWDQTEDDLKGALAECGFVVPVEEDDNVEYLEYDGDLYWLNVNRRGELWINTKEKPRPVFRSVKAQKAVVEEEPKSESQRRSERGPKPETENRKPAFAEASADKPESSEPAGGDETQTQNSKPQTAPASGGAPLPEGSALLDKIRPHMRRNRRGPGGSGSTSFLARALRRTEIELKEAFVKLGFVVPEHPNDKPVFAEFGEELWWLNLDSRGGMWINGRDRKPGETAAGATNEPSATDATDAGTPNGAANAAPADGPTTSPTEPQRPADSAPAGAAPTRETHGVLADVRVLLTETKTGAAAGKVDRLAEELGKSPDDLVATLVGAGLKVPEKSREKPVTVEHAGETLWFSKNGKGELWLNAKTSKSADKDENATGGAGEGEKTAESSDPEKKSRPRSRKKSE